MVLGYICVWTLGMYTQQHYGYNKKEKKSLSESTIWKMRCIDLKGCWGNMSEGALTVYTKGLTSFALAMRLKSSDIKIN